MELASLYTSLQSNSQQLTQLSTDMATVNSKLDSVNASMREELRAIESQLEEHQTQTTSELAGLQRNVTSELHTAMETYTHNEQLITKIDTLDSKLVSVNASMREEIRAIESQLEVHETQTLFTLAGLHSFLQSTYTEELTEISTKMNTLDSKLDSVNASMREELRAIESQQEEHQEHTTSELAGLQSNVTSELAGLHASLQSNTQQLTHLSTDVDTLDSKLDSVNASMREELRDIESQLEEHQTQTTSELSELQKNVTAELVELNSPLQASIQQLTHLSIDVDTLDSKLDAVNVSMREELRAIQSQIKEHQMLTTSELTGLQNNVTSELAGLHTTLQSSTQQLTHLSTDVDTLDSKLDSVNASMREELRDIESQLEEHQTQTTSELSELQKNVTAELVELNSPLQASIQQLTHLSIDVDTLDSKLDAVNVSMREELRAIQSQIKEHQMLTTSELTGLQNNVTSELAGLHTSLRYSTQQLTQLSTNVDTLDLNLNSVNASMREELRAIESQLEEHQTQTTSELAGLQSNVTSELAELNTTLQSSTQQLTHLSINVDTLDSKLDSVNVSIREEFRAIEIQLEEHQTQTTSELAGQHSFLQSNNTLTELTEISTKVDTLDLKLESVNNSDILIREDLSCIKDDLSSLSETMNRISEDVEEHDTHTTTELVNLYEYLQTDLYICGDRGGWRRVVYLDMTDPNTNCPSGWQLTSYSSKRTCDRVSTGNNPNCNSVIFPVSGGDYTRVCGRIIAYQNDNTDGFEAYDDGVETTINGAYFTGVSLTHGSPRQHIWTFVAGDSEYNNDDETCPCDATIYIAIPPFVGEDYFCESGVNSGSISGFHPDDPLWDGQNCLASSTCCSFNRPPYFTKQLPSPTTDDIEARICFSDEDTTPIEFIELYVQ